MIGREYVEFALACGSIFRDSGDACPLIAVVAACASAYNAAGGGKVDIDGSRGVGTGGGASSGVAGLDAFGAAVGRAFLGIGDVRDGSCRTPVASVIGADESNADRADEHRQSGVRPIVDDQPIGKHYWRNKAKREKRKRERYVVGGGGERASGSSVAGTVNTVDSRTAEEIEAAKTLALRRVAENRVAVKLAEHKLRSLEDKSRTDAVERLAAARYEEKINGAKLRSQTSFKKCDDALKSLGSTGSAGEFALKQQIKDAQQNEAMLKYVQAQCDYYQKFASEEVRTHVRCMRPPKPIDAFEVFGDCPSDYDEDEATAYYADLQRQNDEANEKFADWGQNDTLF